MNNDTLKPTNNSGKCYKKFNGGSWGAREPDIITMFF